MRFHPRLAAHRFPAGRRAGAVPLGAQPDLLAARSLPDLPGHDYRGLTVTSVGEEKLYNPRLAESIGENDFVGYMTNLGLPYPSRWTSRCRRISMRQAGEDHHARSGLGAAHLYVWRDLGSAAALARGAPARRADRRRARADEFNGPLGHVPGAKLLPLGGLVSNAALLSKGPADLTVCRSARARPRPPFSSARPASTASPTSPVACCAGAPSASRSRAAPTNSSASWRIASPWQFAPASRRARPAIWHIGGARTALFSWVYARHHGGQFIRASRTPISERSTLASVNAIIDGLRWLGIDWTRARSSRCSASRATAKSPISSLHPVTL